MIEAQAEIPSSLPVTEYRCHPARLSSRKKSGTIIIILNSFHLISNGAVLCVIFITRLFSSIVSSVHIYVFITNEIMRST
jgi:hypothetical protein